MADHQQPSPVRAEKVHQPRLGVEIEVVGRLVEQQGVRLGEQNARQLHTPPLSARHGHHQLVELVGADPQRGGEPLRLGDGHIAAGGGELVVQTGEAGDQPVPLGTGDGLHGMPHGLHPPLQGADRARGQDALEGGHLLVLELAERGLLGEVADGARTGHGALCRGTLAGEHPHQRCLPGTVCTHQPHLVARLQRQGDVGDQPARAGVDGEVTDEDHHRRIGSGSTVQAAEPSHPGHFVTTLPHQGGRAPAVSRDPARVSPRWRRDCRRGPRGGLAPTTAVARCGGSAR